MTERQANIIIQKLDQILNAIGKSPTKQTKKVEQPKELTPFQAAVKIATSKNSSDEQVKQALNTFVESPEILTPSQFAFCLYFLSLNKAHLGEDINYFAGIEVGKHKYSQRDKFIEAVQTTLEEKYKNNRELVAKLEDYLDSLKRK